MNNFDEWCKCAVSQIRYKPDREEVYKELKAHLEDHYDALIDHGHSMEDARRLALEAMGSAEEIAPQLGQVHQPWLGYAYNIITWLTIAACAWALFLLISVSVNHFHAVVSVANFKSLEDDGQDGFYLEPKVSVSCEGYRFRISEAAYSPADEALYLELQTSWWPWMRECAISDHIWAVDSLGNVYSSRWDAHYANIPKLKWGGGFGTGNLYVTTLGLTHFDSDAQWVELHYDRDGRELVLHIDLPGGDGA